MMVWAKLRADEYTWIMQLCWTCFNFQDLNIRTLFTLDAKQEPNSSEIYWSVRDFNQAPWSYWNNNNNKKSCSRYNLNRMYTVFVHPASFGSEDRRKCKAWLSEPRFITRAEGSVNRASGCNVRLASAASAIISY